MIFIFVALTGFLSCLNIIAIYITIKKSAHDDTLILDHYYDHAIGEIMNGLLRHGKDQDMPIEAYPLAPERIYSRL